VAALPTLDGVADGFTRGLKAEKKDRAGVGVGVGVGAALSDNTKPSRNADFSQKILPVIFQASGAILSKPSSIRAMLKALRQKNLCDNFLSARRQGRIRAASAVRTRMIIAPV
jgi:hypothetical protein